MQDRKWRGNLVHSLHEVEEVIIIEKDERSDRD
jgi:hypothetical protein